jgi:hypothetical protein
MKKRFSNFSVFFLVLLAVTLSCSSQRAEAAYYAMENLCGTFGNELQEVLGINDCYSEGMRLFSVNEQDEIVFSGIYLYSNGEWSQVPRGARNNVGHTAILTLDGIYLHDGTETTLVVPISAIPGAIMMNDRGLDINDSDQIVFGAVFNDGSYQWTTIYLYDNGTITNVTNNSHYWPYGKAYQKWSINEQGEVALLLNWAPTSGGRTDVVIYDGSSLTNITNLPKYTHASVRAFNNAGEIMYTVEGQTFVYDGLQSVELTKDSQSISCDGGMNDAGLVFCISSSGLFLYDGTAWEDILPAFPEGTTYSSSYTLYDSYIDNFNRIFFQANTPQGSSVASGEYLGTVQPFLLENVTASNIGEDAATISWTTEVSATSQVEYGDSPRLGQLSDLNPVYSTTHSFTLTGLQPFTTYLFRGYSVSALDEEAHSPTVSFKTLDLTPPSAPQVTGSALDSNTIQLDWSASTDNVGVTGYVVYRDGYEIIRTTQTTYTNGNLGTDIGYSYYVVAYDESGNYSVPSNTAYVRTDVTPPSAITDMRIDDMGVGNIALTWTAPGDNGSSGTAFEYDIRYSAEPITADNFSLATRYANAPAPGAPGSTEIVTVDGLDLKVSYYFAIKTGDEIPNWSEISNVEKAKTKH